MLPRKFHATETGGHNPGESALLRELKAQVDSLRARVKTLEEEIRRLRGKKETAPVPIPVVAPAIASSRPASRPKAAGRSRTRSTPRPTVSYREDPRTPSSAPDSNCAEAGCERPVRSRGLCSKHYQRMRYRERKLEDKRSLVSPLPPPPPPAKKTAAIRAGNQGGTRGVFAILYDEKGRKILAGLINQMKFDRSDLVKRLNETYQGMPGVPLEEEDVLRSVHYHHLGEALQKREGEIVCRHLNKQRGSLVKTAQKIKLSIGQLKQRIEELELIDETTRIRNAFREEILERSFGDRLDLALTKEKYLEDLGIETEVDSSLRRELNEHLNGVDERGTQENQARICRALSLDFERFRRMVRRFGLDHLAESANEEAATENPS